MPELEIPDWRGYIRDLIDELRDDRIGRPSRAIDDEDLVNAIEDAMDYAFTEGTKHKPKTARSLERRSVLD